MQISVSVNNKYHDIKIVDKIRLRIIKIIKFSTNILHATLDLIYNIKFNVVVTLTIDFIAKFL